MQKFQYLKALFRQGGQGHGWLGCHRTGGRQGGIFAMGRNILGAFDWVSARKIFVGG